MYDVAMLRIDCMARDTVSALKQIHGLRLLDRILDFRIERCLMGRGANGQCGVCNIV